MADTAVATDVDSGSDTQNLGLQGPYWIDTQTAVIVLMNSSQALMVYRTTNGGSSWTNLTSLDGFMDNFACWFDQETPGNTGTLLHVAWLDSFSDVAKYETVDISDGTTGGDKTVASGLTVSPSGQLNRIAVTQTVSGNIIVAFSTQTEIACYKSSDNFATAGTVIADPFETATEEDWLLLYPAGTGDDNDAAGIFWDRSTNTISLKMYDDSADSWTETSISAGQVGSGTYINMDASVRHSDNHILLANWSTFDSGTADLRTWDLTVDSISSPVITFKSNIIINQGESVQPSVLINQQNDDVYVAYLKGGTWLSSTDVVFHKSDDGISTWETEQAYSETTDDNRLVHGGRTIGDSGGRVQWSWYNDDLSDIFVSLVNDIEITASGDPTTQGIGSVTGVQSITL